jgi:hypothetical protein
MAITATSPVTGDEVQLDLTVEADEGIFLALVGEADGEEVIELHIDDKEEIREFFLMVARARVAYDKEAL